MKKYAVSITIGVLFFGTGFSKNNNIVADDEKSRYVIAEAGFAIGSGDYGMNVLKLNLIGGYKINRLFSAGAGLGIRSYSKIGSTLIPLMIDFRTQFLKSPITPYVSLSVGYSFDATNSFAGVGYLINPVAGVSFTISEKSRLILGIGYDLQNVSEIAVSTSAISFNVGISF